MSAAIKSIPASAPTKATSAEQKLAQSLGDINEAAADTMASIDALADAILALLPEQPNDRRIFAVQTLVDQDIRGAVGRLVELIDGANTRCELQQPGVRDV